jgi:hypothetical protein
METTKKIIYEMLTENTGSHFLDSGGAYGRNHERNAKKTINDFEAEPVQFWELNRWKNKETKKTNYDIIRTLSVFHYLSELDIDDICEEFNEINLNADNWNADADCYGVSSEAWAYLQKYDAEITHTFNTYNGDSDLSQVLQGSYVDIDGEKYLILQVHGGCDVRGGYTTARLFCLGYDEMINPYLMEYIDSYSLRDEIEYIDEVYCNDKHKTIKFTKSLKNKVLNNL